VATHIDTGLMFARLFVEKSASLAAMLGAIAGRSRGTRSRGG